MIKKLRATVILTAYLTISNIAYSEVYNCSGTYSNIPCSSKTLPDSSKSNTEDAAKEHERQLKKTASQKKSLTHELVMKSIRANKEYKLNYNTSIIEDYCAAPEVSVIDCNSKVSELSDKIDDRIASLEEIKAQKKANEINEEKLKQEDKNKIVIINQQYYERRRRPYRDPRNLPSRTESGYSAGIKLKSKDGSREISGGISGSEKRSGSPVYTNDSVIRQGAAAAPTIIVNKSSNSDSRN